MSELPRRVLIGLALPVAIGVAAGACGGSKADEARAAPTAPGAPAGASDTAFAAPPVTATAGATAATVTCDAAVPAAACDAVRAQHPTGAAAITVSACKLDAPARIGAWGYAVVAPPYTPTESITSADLAARWTSDTLLASAETQAALAGVLGATHAAAITDRPDVTDARWAIVPAHELLPAWKVITVDDKHPLADAAANPLAIGLCANAKLAAPVTNLDRDKLTIFAMTGTTAMTRYMAPLIDQKGTAYPAKDVAPWFANADFVHVSNEVSFVPDCKQGKATMEFCARESYIETLEAVRANVVELTGSHLSDYGTKWISHTLDMYVDHHMRWFGGGHDQIEATTPLRFDHHGNHFALIGCNMVRTTSHEIRDELPDTAACDLDRMDWQIRDLRAHGILPLVSIQHEEVYVHDPPDVIVSDFRRLAKTGAAFVFGSQAHCAHPWEMHDGAYLHYGAGNFFFDQEGTNTRDGTADKLYIYDNKLLSVGQLYTRLEENGRPRPLDAHERAGYLDILRHTLAKLPKAKPWGEPAIVPPAREHADSMVFHNDNLGILVYAPRAADADLLPGGGKRADAPAKFALVIWLHKEDLRGGSIDKLMKRGLPAELAAPDATETAFVASPHLRSALSWDQKLIDRVTQFMIAKYPIDPAQVTIRRE
nr:CapA family protein [Kofleriaceae bacterium]